MNDSQLLWLGVILCIPEAGFLAWIGPDWSAPVFLFVGLVFVWFGRTLALHSPTITQGRGRPGLTANLLPSIVIVLVLWSGLDIALLRFPAPPVVVGSLDLALGSLPATLVEAALVFVDRAPPAMRRGRPR